MISCCALTTAARGFVDGVARLVDLCEFWVGKRRLCRVEITLVLVDSGVKGSNSASRSLSSRNVASSATFDAARS